MSAGGVPSVSEARQTTTPPVSLNFASVSHGVRHVLRDPHEFPPLLGAERAVDRMGLQAGEPGFEPGFMVLETMRVAIDSLPWDSRDGTDRATVPSDPRANICSSMAYDIARYQAVMTLLGTGLSDYRIAAQTGVSRATVRNWRLAPHPLQTVERAELAATWSVRDGPSYCYLLGAYLGDGTIHAQKGISLCIVNDRRYAGVSSEILGAMAKPFSGETGRAWRSSSGSSGRRRERRRSGVRAEGLEPPRAKPTGT